MLLILLFVIPFSIPFLLKRIKELRWGLPVKVFIDPDNPQAKDICMYLSQIAARLDEKPQRMCVRFYGRNRNRSKILLDLESDGRLKVTVGENRPARVDLRSRWIADHKVPLSLHHAKLYVEPVDGNRFRVMSNVDFKTSSFVYVICSLAATFGVVRFSPEILVASAAVAIASYLAGLNNSN